MVYLLKMVIFHGYFNNQMVWKVIGCTMMYPPEICYMSWKITMFENRFFLGTEWAMASTNYQVLHWETFVIKPLEISLCMIWSVFWAIGMEGKRNIWHQACGATTSVSIPQEDFLLMPPESCFKAPSSASRTTVFKSWSSAGYWLGHVRS